MSRIGTPGFTSTEACGLGVDVQAVSKFESRSKLMSTSAGAVLYYAAFFLYSLVVGFEATTFEDIAFGSLSLLLDLAQVVVLALLMLKMLMERANPGSWLLVLCLLLVGFVSWRQSGDSKLFWCIIFIVCGEEIRIRNLAVASLCALLAVVTVTVTCAYYGAIEDIIYARSDGTIRHAMGFDHPNKFGLYFFMICTNIAIIRFEKPILPSVILLMISAFVCIVVANSRTTAILSIVEALLLVLFRTPRTDRGKYRTIHLSVVIMVFSLVVSLYFMVFYDSSNALHAMLDEFTNTRLYWAHRQLTMAPLTLLGNDYVSCGPLFYSSDGSPVFFYVDNAYACLILKYGLIPSLLFLAAWMVVVRDEARRAELNVVLFGLTVLAIYGIMESYPLAISCNFFLISVSKYLYRNRCASRLSGLCEGAS